MKMRFYIEKATGNLISTLEELSPYRYTEVDVDSYIREMDELERYNQLQKEQAEGQENEVDS